MGFCPGSCVEISATRMGLNGATRMGAAPRGFGGRRNRPFRRRIGDDLDRREHFPGRHHGVRGKRRHRHRFIDAVDGIDSGRIEHDHAGLLRIKICPPRKGGTQPCALAGEGLGDAGRRDIFGDVAGFEPGGGHRSDAGGGERVQIGFRQNAAPF